MTSAWRIDKASRLKTDAFSGEGAGIYGGRWNHPGTRIIYAADSLSLAALEKFVHMGDEGRGIDFSTYEIIIPAGVKIRVLKKQNLPKDWKENPAPRSTMDIGTDWAVKLSSAAFKVPSVVIEQEWNYLLNPLHPEFKKIRIADSRPFIFDERM